MNDQNTIPGTIYLNGNRYWWKVRLPGSDKIQQIPLKPYGSRYAAKNLEIANVIAKEMYQSALCHARSHELEAEDKTIRLIVQKYLNHCQQYYRNSQEAENVRYGLTHLLNRHPDILIQDFRPSMLKEIQEYLIYKTTAKGRH